MSSAPTIADIKAAAKRIAGAVVRTPCDKSQVLSIRTGAELYLKFENLQFTGAYKERGALNKLLSLSDEERGRGVIAVSAGNHAQGVAYHAHRLGVSATIVMPQVTPFAKVKNTEALGAEVVLHGNTLAEAAAHAEALRAEQGFVFVHPFNDPLVMAGQGTVGLEVMKAVPDVDDILVPVGGGGLITGVALAAKAKNPRTRVIGVQVEGYSAFHDAFHGVPEKAVPAPVRSSMAVTLAEGIAVQSPGPLSVEMARDLIDDVLVVSEEAIESAILSLLEVEKTVVEGAGAAGLAALNTWSMRFAGRKVAVILTGGNIDLLVLAETTQRGLVRTGRLTRLRISVADLPGALAEITRLVAAHGANIVEVRHGRVFAVSGGRIQLELDIATRDTQHAGRVLEGLTEQGYSVETLLL